MKRWLSLLTLVVLTAGFTANASAAQCNDVKFDDSATVAGQKLVLNGLGIREATFLQVDVYVAAIYLDKKTSDPKEVVDTSTPIKLVLHFVRDVADSDIDEAYKASFAKGTEAQQKKLKPALTKLLKWTHSIKEGETQVFTYIPGKGMEVKLQGKVYGTIKGEDAAQFFLNIWVGPEPPNEGLKVGLLGGECG